MPWLTSAGYETVDMRNQVAMEEETVNIESLLF